MRAVRSVACPSCGVPAERACKSLTTRRTNTDTHKARWDLANTTPPPLKMGELFAGYGGLGMGVGRVLDVDLEWYADVCHFDKDGNAGHRDPHRSPCSILEHHFPGVPNLGDVSRVDWSTVPHVDVLTGGSPCQDLSHAGKRAGMTEGTRSNLWVAMREAIAQLRPSLVLWENVRGAFSAEATSNLESDTRLLAGVRRRDGEPVLRALGRVLGDLSELGYDAVWSGVSASDVGACHGRFRVFVVAFPSDSPCHSWRLVDGDDGSARAARGLSRLLPTPLSRDWKDGELHVDLDRPDKLHSVVASSLLPTTRASDGGGGAGLHGQGGMDLRTAVALLPTPAVNDMGAGKDPDEFDEWRLRQKSAAGDVAVHGKSLDVEARRMLPTPTSQAAKHVTGNDDRGEGSLDDYNLWTVAQRMLPTPQTVDGHFNQPASERDAVGKQVQVSNLAADPAVDWREYGFAVERWAAVTRPAPPPAELSPKGKPRLSPRFSEWMMGLPDGWVTDVPGIRHTEALKALGNGVVPQQAEAALRAMLVALRAAKAA